MWPSIINTKVKKAFVIAVKENN